LKKNGTELLKALSEATNGHPENIIWGKKTKICGLRKKNGTKNGNDVINIVCYHVVAHIGASSLES
jgi:hypothetical protein